MRPACVRPLPALCLCVCLCLLAACGRPQVTLRLPWLVAGHDAGYLLAAERGYYREAGLDVRIVEGKGSATTAQTVAGGSDAFGVVDAATAAVLISRGLPAKLVAVTVQDTLAAFIHGPGVVLRSPRDLLGRPVITGSGAAGLILLPAVLAPAGLRTDQLSLHLTDPATYAAVFRRTRGAVLLGFLDNDYPRLRRLDPGAVATPYARFGVHVYSLGLLAGLRTLRGDPKEVRRFVAASMRGWADAARDPSAAVRATLRAFPQADAAVVAAGLAYDLQRLHTPATRGHPVGWMAASDWERTLRLLGLAGRRPLTDYYTDAFIAPGAA